MFKSIRTRIVAIAVVCLVVVLLLNTTINLRVMRQYNQQAQSNILASTSSSHSIAIEDWINAKMAVIASLDKVAMSYNPAPCLHKSPLQLASQMFTPVIPTEQPY